LYVWLARGPFVFDPSPKSHSYEILSPSGSLEDDASKTVSEATQHARFGPASAIGGVFTLITVFAVAVEQEVPFPSSTITETLYVPPCLYS